MLDIGYLAAFLGGLLALLSPCSALLLPSFFAYAFGGASQILARTCVFFVGLAAVLVPLGAGSGGLAATLTEHRETLIVIFGWVIVALGVMQILGGGWSLQPAAQFQARMAARGTWLSTVGLGAAYGLAGFCTGPILGAVLTVAAVGGDSVRGAFLLAVYALGMAAPLFILTALWHRFDLGHRRWLRGRAFRIGPLRLHTTSTVSGLLFVAVGVMFLRFGGGAGLLALDPRVAVRAEDAAAAFAAHVPDIALLPAVGVVVAAIVVYRLRRASSSPTRSTSSDDEGGPDRGPGIAVSQRVSPTPGTTDG